MPSILALLVRAVSEDPPVVTDDRRVLERVPREPGIPTRTGMTVDSKDLDRRGASPVSIMPEKLAATVTRKEFRDRVTFLEGLQ
jgi:hypothetical protein